MMNLRLGLRCPDCGHKIKEEDSHCSHCGTTLDEPLRESELQMIAEQYLEKAQKAYERGWYMRGALANCEKALEYVPESAEAHNLRGLILDALGKFDEAIFAYKEAVRLDPDYADAADNLQEAETEKEIDDQELALTLLEKARASYDNGWNIQVALFECEKALRYMPESAEAHNLRGLILDEMGYLDKAILAYKEAVRLDPDFEDAKANLLDAEADNMTAL